jgi:hypothetical protein
MTLDPRTLVALLAIMALAVLQSAVGIAAVTVAYFLWPVVERLTARQAKPVPAPKPASTRQPRQAKAAA